MSNVSFMAISETQISKEIRDYLNKRGIYNLRLNSGKVRVRGGWMQLCDEGTPDRYCLFKGKSIFIETKVPGEKPTDEQLAAHDRIRRSGGIIIIAERLDDVIESFSELQSKIDWQLYCLTAS